MSDTRARARMFTLAPEQKIPWHHHSEVTDYYFVLRGRLTIKMRTPDKVCELQAADRHQIEPGTPHLLCNPGAIDCKFLLLQGGGKYDWIAYRPLAALRAIGSHGEASLTVPNQVRPRAGVGLSWQLSKSLTICRAYPASLEIVEWWTR